MDVPRFIIDLFMSLIALYLSVFFAQYYKITKSRSYLVLAVAFAIFVVIDIADNVITNVLSSEILSRYYIHDIIVVLILAALTVVIRFGSRWKQPIKEKK